MSKFIVGTFLILGWTFYELSGGSDFVPEERVVAQADPVAEVETAIAEAEEAPVVEVTRAEPADLLDVTGVEIAVTEVETANVAAEEEVVAEIIAAALIEPIVVEPEIEAVIEPALDIREVAGSRVNMRAGPGTSYDVLDTLPGGTEAEVMAVNADGWARIRIIETDKIGWMAERLLTES